MPDAPGLTPLAVMILALLREGDMHPYEMMRLFRLRRDDRLVRLQKGTLYHTVGRLVRDGLLAEVGVDRDGNRPERTTYALTEAGGRTVDTWVRAELPRIDRASEFRVALAEAHNLDRAEVRALLDERRRLLAASRDDLRSGLAEASRRAVSPQFLVEVERELALVTAELAWQDALTARLADPAYPWGVADLPAEHAKTPSPREKTPA
ncbi:PadR family transcriptional regulator [Microbacterium sp. 10M-3C3]|uniref:PadR family transcriptional regulator n=1 Tax=Microbacterium sp. 10M-3C3 TaxID=2483401 RepID=UPI000F62CAC6|nr:PadR family transcriptional regulator [Microbacterium sp. 10M-3C3]